MSTQYQPQFDPWQLQFQQEQFRKYHRRRVWRNLVTIGCVLGFGLFILSLALILTTPSAPEVTALTCPSETVCYGVGQEFLVSRDGGANWTTHPLEHGLSFINCSTIDKCIAGGGGFIDLTTDGGRTWTTRYTNDKYSFMAIYCGSSDSCLVTGQTRGWRPVWAYLTTANGGKDWKDASSDSALGCPTTIKDCYGSGWVVANTNSTLESVDYRACPDPQTCYALSRWEDIVAVTHNAGTTWKNRNVFEVTSKLTRPFALDKDGNGKLGVFGFAGITCPDTQTCYVFGHERVTDVGNYSQYDLGGGNNGLVVTTDGGSSWTAKPLDTKTELNTMTCPTTRRCVAATTNNRLILIENGGDSWKEAFKLNPQ